MANTLADKATYLGGLMDMKSEMQETLKEITASIENAKAALIEQMIEDECSKIECGGFSYSLQHKTEYNKKSDAELFEAGLDFFEELEREGFGDLIKPRVDPRTLSAAMKNYVEECGELSEGLEAIIRPYEFDDVSRRKAAKKR